MSTATLFYGEAYRRDPDGMWRYAATGDSVPDGRDLYLRDVVPNVRVGSEAAGGVWVSRPLALTTPAFQVVLDETPKPIASFNLPTPVPELPDTKAVIMVPPEIWAAHEGDVVGMLARELHPEVMMTNEMVAAAVGIPLPRMSEYLRRGSCPKPQLTVVGRPLWARPVVARWLATRSSHQRLVPCEGCAEPTEVEGLMIDKPSGVGLLPLCTECYDRLLRLLASRSEKAPLTVQTVRELLHAADEPEGGVTAHAG